ncbi:hypothetical protein P43SY_002835 [Pythium insidiosum]|uniref:TKL protein kinase n=1 Tax=Pythium insidiosum TaxID=114742 RepID=A0AAD5LT45_PYTIN|nr:hypothetical protein P43SY_002835 [Pythium insidiosum]
MPGQTLAVGPVLGTRLSATLPRSNLFLSARAYQAWWAFLVGYHILNGAFCWFAAVCHLVPAHPKVYENLWLLHIPQHVLLLAGASYFVPGFLHWRAAFTAIRSSVNCRRLTFGYDLDANATTTAGPRLADTEVEESNHAQRRWRLHPSLVAISFRGSKQLWRKYFGHDGHLSIHGTHFYHGFYVRQLLEILLQTYQAYHISRSVPRLWINRFVVTMIVINCVYAPLVNLVFKTSPAWRRAVNLMIDVLIDFAIAVIVPLCVFLPRVYQMNWPTPEFPAELVYNDAWLAGALSEARQIMVTSIIDYISSMSPHFIGLADIRTIKRLLRRAPTHATSAISSSQVAPVVPKQVAPIHRQLSPRGALVRSLSALNREERARIQRARWLFTLVTTVWAISVLVLHSSAGGRRTGEEVGCELFAGAWWVSKPACSIVHFNCHRLHVSGAQADLEPQLMAFEPYFITKYTQLRALPPSFGALQIHRLSLEFNQVEYIDDELFRNQKLYRLRLSGNPLAALPQTIGSTSILQRVALEHTQLSLGTHGFLGIHGRQFYAGFYARQAIEIMLQTYQAYQISNSVSNLAINRWAVRLLHSEIPTNMGLTIYGCNISELPREVGDVWAAHKWPYLWLDYNHLRSLPSSFSKMRLRRLSLTYNRFQLLDDDMFANFEFYRLRLTGNPLLHPS